MGKPTETSEMDVAVVITEGPATGRKDTNIFTSLGRSVTTLRQNSKLIAGTTYGILTNT